MGQQKNLQECEGEDNLGPDLKESIPRASAESSAVIVDTEARDTVIVSFESKDKVSLDSIPDAAVVVIISSEKEAA